MSLEEASRTVIALDRARLRAGRELRGKSQAQISRDAGITAAAVSQFENGHARPTSSTLLKIAHALDLPLGYFARRPGRMSDVVPAAFFRSLRSTSVTERRRATALVGLVHELVQAVEHYVALPPVDAPEKMPTDDAGVEEVAASTRRHLGIDPHAPVSDVILAVERHGIVTARFHVEGTKMDAFSVDYPDRPVVVLGADKGYRDRSRFDVAHEVGHLVLHGADQVGTTEAEGQAHRFAAAFLMPAEAIRDELPRRADWERLADLKRKWEVSLAALLKRAQTLGVMNDITYTQAMKTLSARGWRKREPVDLGPAERPMLLSKALEVAAAHGVTLDDLAAEYGLPINELRRVLGASMDPRPRVNL